MATKDLIFQGIAERTHCDEVKDLLSLNDIERVTISVAFINENGVDLIEEELKAVSDRTTVYGGISNGVTSRQGLERLLGLGLDLFVVDTGSPGVLYHPKLYYSRNKDQARFISGSANLTLGGLNNNIEASVKMNLDLADVEDTAFAKSIEDQLDAIRREYPDNVIQVTNSDYLAELMNRGSIIDERTKSTRRSTASGSSSSSAPTPRMKLRVPQVRGGASQVTIEEPVVEAGPDVAEPPEPAEAASKPTVDEAATSEEAVETKTTSPLPAGASNGPLVWSKPDLRNSDAQQPRTENSAITGNVKLTQARFEQAGVVIDQTTYFRNDVFNHLTWNPAGGNQEETSTNFRIIDRGRDLGTFQLRLSHDPDRVSDQGNVPTWLHWGDAMDDIKAANVLGTTLNLYGPDSGGIFTIEFS